jgi:hypothetical protein
MKIILLAALGGLLAVPAFAADGLVTNDGRPLPDLTLQPPRVMTDFDAVHVGEGVWSA